MYNTHVVAFHTDRIAALLRAMERPGINRAQLAVLESAIYTHAYARQVERGMEHATHAWVL